MEKLVNALSRLTERAVKCVFAYDLKVGGYVAYAYYDSCDNTEKGTYFINNPVSLAILTESLEEADSIIDTYSK